MKVAWLWCFMFQIGTKKWSPKILSLNRLVISTLVHLNMSPKNHHSLASSIEYRYSRFVWNSKKILPASLFSF
jgi:hypothetical protein